MHDTVLGFRPDGRQLLVVDGADNVVALSSIIWRGDAAARRARLCAAARRDLSPSEWHRYLPGTPYRRTCSGD